MEWLHIIGKNWSKKIAQSKPAMVAFAICIIVSAAYLVDHVFHAKIAHFSLLLPFFYSGYFFLNAKLISYKLVNGHIKIIGLGMFVLADLQIENISSVHNFSPFSQTGNFRGKNLFVYRLGNSLSPGKIIVMRNGRTFAITPDPGSAVDSILNLKI